MKKILALLLLLLTCCSPLPAENHQGGRPTPEPTVDWRAYQPSREAFNISEACPHMCWLGINPGVTTQKEAHDIVVASDQINHKGVFEETDTGIVVDWFTEKSKKLTSNVYLHTENGIVQSLSFEQMAPFTTKDFLDLLGTPAEVSITADTNGNVSYTRYQVFYRDRKILPGAETVPGAGPSPDDLLVILTLNVDYQTQYFRPWLGYGHLDEYMAAQKMQDEMSPSATP